MNKYAARVRNEDGFTLIELMVVIIILAVLAGIVLFAVGGITNRGAAAACKTDLATITTAVEASRAQDGQYPPNLSPYLTTTEPMLHPQPGLGAADLVQNGGAGGNNPDGYTISYDNTTGAVTASRANPGGTPFNDCGT